MSNKVPEHIKKSRIKSDQERRESRLRNVDQFFSNEKTSIVLTTVLIFVLVVALSGSAFLIIFIF